MVVTISDVAKKAGVAISTVSKVLNNYEKVSEATREKVLKAAQELNYVPNSIASALSSKKYQCIALYVYINNKRQSIDELNMSYLFGSFEKANELGIKAITIFSSTVADYSKNELVRYLQSMETTALVVFGLNKDDKVIHEIIDEQLFNVVVVDAPITNDRTSSVSVDHMMAQYEVAKRLIAKEECKKILYLAGRKDGYVTDERLAGMMKLQNELHFEMNVQHADFSEKKAKELTRRYGDRADGIVCASDLMAIGAVSSLREMNIFRPCCGFDGISLMGYVGSGMLTCKQDFYQIAKVAIEEANYLIQGNQGRKVTVDYEITRLSYEDVIM